jgi:hypothetical protein
MIVFHSSNIAGSGPIIAVQRKKQSVPNAVFTVINRKCGGKSNK